MGINYWESFRFALVENKVDQKELTRLVRRTAGKYVDLKESYKSLTEALIHGGVGNNARVIFNWIDAEDLEKENGQVLLAKSDGILVPGGFGDRGIEGKINAVQYSREKKVPFFGICLGMHCAAIEFARHVANLKKANSSEFSKTSPYLVIDL